MGSGKTTIGRRLAVRLSIPFLDTDREIERAFGLSVAEIFSRYGEEAFRAAERETIHKLLSGKTQVLALGGGTYVDDQMRSLLNERAVTIWLDPPFELILERLEGSSHRPLASAKSPDELRRLWDERRPKYADAHLRIVTTDPNPAAIVGQILEALT